MKILKIKEGGITSPAGFSAGAVYAGIKSRKSYKPDVAVLLSDRPAACAALFTTNRFCAAPVTLGREIAARGYLRGIVINSGNANAGTGEPGMAAARAVKAHAEAVFGLEPDSLLVSSTGVIGEQLPVEKVKKAVEEIAPLMSREMGSQAAWAIMTTDRKRKEGAWELSLSGGTVRVGVMAKGSGMIHPNMATTLCFIATDALMEPAPMKAMLKKACDESFHALTVDGDTSTNDSLIMFANGASERCAYRVTSTVFAFVSPPGVPVFSFILIIGYGRSLCPIMYDFPLASVITKARCSCVGMLSHVTNVRVVCSILPLLS